MSQLERVSGMTETTTREGTCPCGGSIIQTGTKIGDRWFWAPKQCVACATRHLEERQADVARSREEDERAERELREARHQRGCQEMLAWLKPPPLFAGVTLQSFEVHGSPEDKLLQTRIRSRGLRYCAEWPEPEHLVTVLRGGPGTGKGHWAWSVAKEIAGVHAARVQVIKLSDLVRRLRAPWRRESDESEEEVLALFRELDLLVIDELSRHAFYGEQIHQHLYDVLDHRLEHQRPTILTSNEDDRTLAEIIRPALSDRLRGVGAIVEFGTASYRARAR